MLLRAVGVSALLFVGAGAAVGPSAAAPAAAHTVVIEGVRYEPEIVTAKPGEAVIWVNKDPFPHTVTAKGSFDSHEIAPGKSWKLIAPKAGEYAYICTLHPNMMATLKVK